MNKYLLIGSRDPFTSADAQNLYTMALELEHAGNDVSVYLVQNGVLPTRVGAKFAGFGAILGRGITVMADRFSLQERGIPQDALMNGVTASELDIVIDHMAEGAKVIWH